MNHYAKYAGQKLFRSNNRTDTHTNSGPAALPEPLKWSVIIKWYNTHS